MKLKKLACKRCGHKWVPRTEIITTCPKCRSPYWDRERSIKSTSHPVESK